MDKNKFLCSAPFSYSEVHDDKQWLCCPSWLPVDIWDGKSIKSSFYSEKANEVRESILDGSYKYCDENQCPYLSGLKNNFQVQQMVRKDKKSIDHFTNNFKLNTINFCFDRSCNLQCPSCRIDFINYIDKDREGVEEKLKQVNKELSSNIKNLYLSGTADPFYSKSFRQFLINFDPSLYPELKNIHLHTNATLWTPNLWERMETIHPFVGSCEISIDAATKETYENKTRIGGKWEVLLKNLEFITTINTIKHFVFSFVVQDSNFREIKLFHNIITNYMKESKSNFDIFYNNIVNWGTFTDKEYQLKDVSNPNHTDHQEFLEALDSIKDLPHVTSNLNHLFTPTQKLL